MSPVDGPPLNPRCVIGGSLSGDVLEIGPGTHPFPTALRSAVKFADKKVEGGRDVNWPELVGQLHGPNPDFVVDLDSEGLSCIDTSSFDVVIACHVFEHLANPLSAMLEVRRVLRPGGRFLIVLPDRTHTFDRVRKATPYAHIKAEFDQGVNRVSDAHILEFCEAIAQQPPIHPPVVRAWHDPTRLDPDLYELHRRRSIHVHCWRPEEFASAIAAAIADDVMTWDLDDLYFPEDSSPNDPCAIEFGLVLQRPENAPYAPTMLAEMFAERWASLATADGGALPRKDHVCYGRVATFLQAIEADSPVTLPPGLRSLW